jgi:integrase
VKENTIARELTIIKAILNWSVKRRPPMIPFNPVRDYKGPSRKDAIIPPPSQDEIRRIYKNAPGHLQRFIQFSSYIGARPGPVEILSLRWQAVSWKTGRILIVSADKGGPQLRQVPIHKDFLGKLREWFDADVEKYGKAAAETMAIINYYGRPITTIKNAWNSALANAKITRRIRPYDLRHRFVTKALEDGADIGTLSQIVGSRPETLRKHYQHVTSQMHRQIMDRITGLGADDS